MSHVTIMENGLVIDDSALEQLRNLNLQLVTDGEKVLMVGAHDNVTAIKVADKAHVLDAKTVH